MDRLFKLSFPRPNSALIGLWACQRCGSVHDSVESWVQVGVGDEGRDAQIVCPACVSELSSEPASGSGSQDPSSPGSDGS